VDAAGLNPADTQIGPRTPAPSGPSSQAPKLKASVPDLVPRSAPPQASFSRPLSYAAAVKSTGIEPKIDSLAASSASPTRYAITVITQASEPLGLGSLPRDADQGPSHASASGDLTAPQIGDSRAKSPRPSLPYLTEFKKVRETNKAKKAAGQTSSQTTETPSAIRDAFLAAPSVKSFNELIKQTSNIVLVNSLTTQGAQARELSEIGSRTVFKPNYEVFNATGAFKRTRSPAFLQLSQPKSSTSATTQSQSQAFVGSSIQASEPTPGQVACAVQNRIVPHPTAAILPAQVQASYATPLRGSLAYRNIGSISGRRRPLHLHSHSFSQPATRFFSASRPAPLSFSASRLPNRFQFVTPTKSSTGFSQPLTLGSPLDLPNDTEEQKQKIGSIMSSFREVGDSYDTIVWLSSERRATCGESPEPLTVPPQPVASYTTVGSLKPATNQHFTAPNRIQRDGTSRRASQANLHGRSHDNHFGGRSMNQQYNPGYGSSTNPQYGAVNQPQFGPSTQTHLGSLNQPQHGSASQSRFGSPALPQQGSMSQPQYGVPDHSQYGAPSNLPYGSISRSQYGTLRQYGSENQNHYRSSSQSGFGSIHNLQNLNGTNSVALTDAEKKVLQANGLSEPLMEYSAPSMRSGNTPLPHRDMVQKIDPSLNPKAQSFNLHYQLKDDGSGQPKATQNSLPKIENMQNFSQQENHMQQLAKDHLGEGTTTLTQYAAMSTGAHIAQQSAMTGTTSYGQTANGDNNQGNSSYESQDRGDLDHSYRFPPPGLVHPIQAYQTGASCGQQMALGFGSYEQLATNQQYQIRSGRPQPLTAGPPGQRQNASLFTTGISSAQGIQVGSSQLSNMQSTPGFPSNSPWASQSRSNMFTSVPMEHSNIRDTLSIEEVRKYYPNGFPKDMTSRYTRLPGLIDENRPGMTEGEIKTEKTNKWFHAGLTKLNKTANDHVADMEKRNYNLNHGLHPQHRLHTGNLDEYGNPLTLKDFVATAEPLTVEEIAAMPWSEVAAHLTAPVFGNLLNLADQRPIPNNLSTLSRFVPSPAWAIDNTEQGNQSCYGEDWGTAPKRVGRDPRYQPQE
jgi:hypothetical protein